MNSLSYSPPSLDVNDNVDNDSSTNDSDKASKKPSTKERKGM